MKVGDHRPSGILPLLWRGLTSARLTFFLVTAIIAVLLFSTVIAQAPTTPVALERLYAPDALYFMKLAGLTDVFHSNWFYFILIALVLNLVLAAIDQLPAVLRLAAQAVPPVMHAAHVRSDKYLRTELKAPVGREDFRDWVTTLARKRVGEVQTLVDEGGNTELQLAAQRGRFTGLGWYVAQLGLVLVALGGMWGGLRGFEGQLSIDDGGRVGFLQLFKGKAPDWKPLEDRGRILPGFYDPGFEAELSRFEIEYYPHTFDPRAIRSQLRFYEKGNLVASRDVAVNAPATYHDLEFYQGGFADTGQSEATLLLTDKKEEFQERIPTAFRGSSFDMGAFKFKVLNVVTELDTFGPAAELEYQEAGQAPENLWVFARHPEFDPLHRRKARVNFKLESMRPRYTSGFKVVHNPGVRLVWSGVVLLLLGLFAALFARHERYWFSWKPGLVTVTGWSDRLEAFEPRFQKSVSRLQAGLRKGAS